MRKGFVCQLSACLAVHVAPPFARSTQDSTPPGVGGAAMSYWYSSPVKARRDLCPTDGLPSPERAALPAGPAPADGGGPGVTPHSLKEEQHKARHHDLDLRHGWVNAVDQVRCSQGRRGDPPGGAVCRPYRLVSRDAAPDPASRCDCHHPQSISHVLAIFPTFSSGRDRPDRLQPSGGGRVDELPLQES
jgi:hypothetical protein